MDITLLSFRKNGAIKTRYIFLLILSLNITVSHLYNIFVFNEQYYEVFFDNLSITETLHYYEFVNQTRLLAYLFIPIILWLKIIFITCIIQLPLLLSNINLNFYRLFRISTIAISVYIISSLYKLLELLIYDSELESLNHTPLSLAGIVNTSQYPESSVELLNNINFFELMWIVIMIAGLVKTKKVEILDSINIVLGTWVFLLIMQFGLSFYLKEIF